MIAYRFPPDGAAGVYRPLRFSRQLPAMGWWPSVISADLAPYGWYRYDPALLALVPGNADVVRVGRRDLWHAIQARRAHRMQERLSKGSVEKVAPIHEKHDRPIRSFIREVVQTAEAWCYHPDMAMFWIRPAVEATVQMCARKKRNVIWATAGPVSSLIVAQRASQRTGVPYVLDFRDAWTITYNEFEARRPAWARRLDWRNLDRLLKEAQAVIFRYETEAECYWRAYQGALDASRIHIIPNGYEGAIDEFAVSEADRCVILYTGTLSSYRYDTLLQAIHWLKKSDPAEAQRLRLLFVGENMEALRNEAAALDISDVLETAGPTSHAEIARLQREAHALLVLGRPPTMRGYELFAGAKLFGYLKAGRPIVGVLPPDETKRILEHVGVSTVADADSPSEIVAVFRQLLAAWSAKTLSALVPNRTACEAYSAERQTAALVRALEGVPAAEPFVPGSVEIPPSLRDVIGKGGWVRGKDMRPLPERERVRVRV